MPVNPGVIMGGQQPDTATPINAAAQQQSNNALNHEQLLKTHYEAMDAREKSRLTSTVAGAAQLKTFLERDDLDGAHNFLMQRKTSLQGRMGSGENVDTQETDFAIEALRSGNVEELRNNIDGLLAAGQVYGILDKSDMPANVREWHYYNSLKTPEERAEYINLKRSSQVVNLGNTQLVLGPDGKPKQEYNVGLRPEDQPKNAAEKSKAEAVGKAAGESEATNTNTSNKMQGLITSFEALKTASVGAPSGAIANTGATLANQSGMGGTAAQAQGVFKVRRADAENQIRSAFRVVGSGAQSDADAKPFIDMLPDENDADDVKASRVNAALQATREKIADLARQRSLTDPFTDQGASSKVRVSNGRETFMIDPNDLAAAQAEGFKQQ